MWDTIHSRATFRVSGRDRTASSCSTAAALCASSSTAATGAATTSGTRAQRRAAATAATTAYPHRPAASGNSGISQRPKYRC
jgi:hypothetical protein